MTTIADLTKHARELMHKAIESTKREFSTIRSNKASPSLLDMSRSFLASRSQQITKIVLPSASGLIFAGMRLGAAQGFTGVILAELLITPTGIGDLITYYRSIADYPRMFASILSIIIVASVAINLLQKVEETVFRPELRR